MGEPLAGAAANQAPGHRAPSTAELRQLRTRVVHAGEDPTAPVRPLSEPIAPSTVFAFRDPSLADLRRAAEPPEANYGRDGLLNVRTLERAVARLEGAEDAHATASGMAAIALVFLAFLSSEDQVVVSADCYCDTTALLTDELARFGVDARFVDAADLEMVRAALTPRTRLVYVETISNPAMKLADLPRLAEIAHGVDALLCVDNTFATPLLCRPLEHGADLVLHSATKYLGGHHDLTAGIVAGRRSLLDPIRRCGYRFGPTLGPMDAWLAVRGLHTLAPRIAWISETTATVAGYLKAHSAVSAVRYPGLPDHPQAELAGRLLSDGAGGMLAFDLAGGAVAAAALIRRLSLIPYAPSLGGTTTTICYPPRDLRGATGGDRNGSYCCSTLRLSVGLEAAADLIADLDQAFAGLPATPVATAAAGAAS